MAHSFVSNEGIEQLSRLATAAITSPAKDERERAAKELRFLSNYESWELLKEIFPIVQNNYLRFLLTKCFLFNVKNELGSEERHETFLTMIRFLCSQPEYGEGAPPKFVRMGVYSVIASAFYSKWKLMLVTFSAEESSDGTEESSQHLQMPDCFEDLLKLPMLFRVECLKEILFYHCEQITRDRVLSLLKTASIDTLFPEMISHLAVQIESFPALVLEVSVAVLSTTFDQETTGGTNWLRTVHASLSRMPEAKRRFKKNNSSAIDSSISGSSSNPNYSRNLLSSSSANWKNWEGPLNTLLTYSLSSLSREDFCGEARQHASCLLQICAAISPDANISPLNNSFVLATLDLSRELLFRSFNASVQEDKIMNEEDLLLALSLLSSAAEHSPSTVIQFLEGDSENLASWTTYFLRILEHYDHEKEDLYIGIVNFFCDLCSLLQQSTFSNSHTSSATLERTYQRNLKEGGIADEKEMTSGGALSPTLSKIIITLASLAFRKQLEHVVRFSQLQEDSFEVFLDEGVTLHSERALQPIAELLFSQEHLFFPILEEKLSETIKYYEIFRGMRDKLYSSPENVSPFPWSAEEVHAISSFASLSPSMASAALSSCSSSDGALFLQALEREGGALLVLQQLRLNLLVCLSRLSVAISIFGTAIRRGRIPKSKDILGYVTSFSSPLLNSDDALTETLMENLSLDNSCSGNRALWQNDAQQLHFGIIRSLFFFCQCIFDVKGSLEMQESFHEIILSLLRFVYLNHSTHPCLMNDANSLLATTLSSSLSSRHFLASEKMLSVLEALKENRIQLLQRNFLTSCEGHDLRGYGGSHLRCGGETYIEDCRRARFSFLTNVVSLIEMRFYAGCSGFDVLDRIVLNQLTPEGLELYPTESLGNLHAITSGCSHPDIFFAVINRVLQNESALAAAVHRAVGLPLGPQRITRWCSKVCELAAHLETDCTRSFFTYEVLTFTMQAMITYFQWLEYGGSNALAKSTEYEERNKMRYMEGCLLLEGGGCANVADDGCSGDMPLRIEDAIINRFTVFQGTVNLECLYDMFEVLKLMASGKWCNLGVVARYDELTLKTFFTGLIQAFLSISPELLMSDIKRREVLFEGLVFILENGNSTTEFMFYEWLKEEGFEKILDHAVKCLSCCYLPALIMLIKSILTSFCAYEKFFSIETRRWMDENPIIQQKILVNTFRETLFVLLTAPYLQESQIICCFRVLTLSFNQAEQSIQSLLTTLLECCSAYHRVRIRLIMSLMKGKQEDCTEIYFRYFGHTSKVEVLTAW